MPLFNCVKCYDCGVFQSSQARKDKKFSCKMCGKKQSVIKAYAKSESGKELRKIVQQMNMTRGTADEEYEIAQAERADEEMTDGYSHEQFDNVEPAQSKWAQFEQAVNAVESVIEQDLPYDDNDAMFVTSEPDWQGRRGRKRARRTENTGDENDDGERRGRRPKPNSIEDGPPTQIDRLRALCQPSLWRNDDGMSTQQSRRSGRPPSYPRNQQHNTVVTPRRVSAPRERQSYTETVDNGFVTTTGGDEVFEEEVM